MGWSHLCWWWWGDIAGLGGTGYASLPALRDNIFSLLHSTGVFRFCYFIFVAMKNTIWCLFIGQNGKRTNEWYWKVGVGKITQRQWKRKWKEILYATHHVCQCVCMYVGVNYLWNFSGRGNFLREEGGFHWRITMHWTSQVHFYSPDNNFIQHFNRLPNYNNLRLNVSICVEWNACGERMRPQNPPTLVIWCCCTLPELWDVYEKNK